MLSFSYLDFYIIPFITLITATNHNTFMCICLQVRCLVLLLSWCRIFAWRGQSINPCTDSINILLVLCQHVTSYLYWCGSDFVTAVAGAWYHISLCRCARFIHFVELNKHTGWLKFGLFLDLCYCCHRYSSSVERHQIIVMVKQQVDFSCSFGYQASQSAPVEAKCY